MQLIKQNNKTKHQKEVQQSLWYYISCDIDIPSMYNSAYLPRKDFSVQNITEIKVTDRKSLMKRMQVL